MGESQHSFLPAPSVVKGLRPQVIRRQDRKQESDLTVQIYVRPRLLLKPLDATIATVQRLETEGIIDAVTVQAWPDKVPRTDPTTVP